MIIQSKNVYLDEKLRPAQLEIEQGMIKTIMPYGTTTVDHDYGDAWILPGLIDIHNHGYLKGDANHATVEWLDQWTSYLPSEGVTGTMSTISTYPYQPLLESLKVIGDYLDHQKDGHTIIHGVYEEGPFISSTHPGAQSLENKVVPTIDIVKQMDAACNHHLRYVMIAPEELNGDYSVIDYCVSHGMVVTLGHTGATYAIADEAIQHGATSFTHTYNGMSGLHHREPGCVGYAMNNENVYAELICDGVHVKAPAARVLANAKGKDKLVMITDSVAIKGLPIGHYHDDTRDVEICEDGVGRLANGTIAGSCNRLNKVLYFAIHHANIDLTTAINAVTKNPCDLLHINNKGVLKVGYDADIAVFDENMDPIDVYIAGKVVYTH